MADASNQAAPAMSPIDMLIMAVPGRPGQDYPILAEVPETSFNCDGRTEGGYYADQEADCQPFHVCVNEGGSLSKFSFLCPNGTLFNQVRNCTHCLKITQNVAFEFFNFGILHQFLTY